MPLLSVILPVYNGEVFLRETIDSILNQSFRDFELLIINDASTDASESIIGSYDDIRIRYIKNDKNLKLIKTLNKALSLASGRYVARIDADDRCLPERFAKQIDFLKRNPSIAVVGTNVFFINEKGGRTGLGIVQGQSPHEIKWELNRRCCLYHPSVMLNVGLLGDDLFYDDAYTHAEDYELWLRLRKTYDLANINEPLLEYRIHSSSITQTYNREAIMAMLRALKNHNFLVTVPGPQAERYIELLRFPMRIDKDDDYASLIGWLLREVEIYNTDAPESNKIKLNLASYLFISSFFYMKNIGYFPISTIATSLKKLDLNSVNVISIVKVYIINIYRRLVFRYLPFRESRR